MNDEIVPIRGKTITEVGGLVDSSSASLCLYGETLDPDSISKLLGTQPTTALRRGQRPGPGSSESPRGVWILRVEGNAPAGPEQHLRQLLMRLPSEGAAWAELRSQYQARFSVSIHLDSWNRGFTLSPDLLRELTERGIELDFDIYADTDDEA